MGNVRCEGSGGKVTPIHVAVPNIVFLTEMDTSAEGFVTLLTFLYQYPLSYPRSQEVSETWRSQQVAEAYKVHKSHLPKDIQAVINFWREETLNSANCKPALSKCRELQGCNFCELSPFW